ncbi:formimidoylglutamase [Roseivirga sp. E12]|uniref:formimidoylglutamase n=1 Tax=Roseivirga sp. E12 TaxID=2819237 RepID=UPI001ABCD0C0|nr:formimidoylglutamase [Roseivirga sp. E12]MBO3696943.1 formimidoylglutamase [Roseivirga sp. E12]
MSINRLTVKQTRAFTKVRKGESKIGEFIHTLNTNKLSELKSFKEKGAQFCLIGIPECIGVLGNYGNPGTERAWDSFLSAFLNVQSNRFLSGSEFLVAGVVDVEDLQRQALETECNSDYFAQKMHVLCESLDALVAPIIESVVQSGLIPIVIGGGHNNAYPILQGVSLGLNRRRGVHCINLDAHADYRALEGRHSGNGFSYAKSGGFLDKYLAFGLHQSYNGEQMLKMMDTTKNVRYHFLEDVEYLDKDLSKALEFVFDEHVPCGIELDMDAIRMMPSSAISPTGFSVEQARQFIRKSAKALKVAYLHLPEAAPDSELDSRLVGKSLAYLVTDFAKAIHKKSPK